jgi:demethylmenaquinone methyltransferase / 2-methoxy-6-polyprenyl-1,4-benzoquinol methylase
MSVAPGSPAMFDLIAHRYDLLNRVLSLGIDQRWRRRAVELLNLRPHQEVLDVATGTCDLAIILAEQHPSARVTGLDGSERMLALGRGKLARAGVAERVTLVQGDIHALPFGDASFDAATMAFGIRNAADRPRALAEMARILRPGGRVAILELAEPQRGLLAPAVQFHLHRVVPFLGGLVSRVPEYRYLQRSIAAFPAAELFAPSLVEAGLRVEAIEALTFGVASIFVASR